MVNEGSDTHPIVDATTSTADGALAVRDIRGFLCYRRNDGAWYAEWLNEHLAETTYIDSGKHLCRLRLYYDKTAPGVSDWQRLHFPSLQASRALIVVCTPGIAKDFSRKGHPDWVYEELKWWVRNRRTAPIVVDTTGEGDRWLPEMVIRKWPNINRIDLNREQADAAASLRNSEFADRIKERVIGAIRESEHATVFEDLERVTTLNWWLKLSLFSAIAFALLALFGALAALTSRNEANTQRLAAISQLRAQLGSDDPVLVVSAIDQLRLVYERPLDEVAKWIPAEKVSSHKWFALVGAELHDAVRSKESHVMPLETINALARLTSQAKRIGPPPSVPDDDRLNHRVFIKGGTFSMGDDCGYDETPRHPVTLSGFLIQEHEVTNAEYRRFDPDHDPAEPGNLPVVKVTWYDAMAYALWIGGNLPTEAQWEFAARGEQGRKYPWGDAPVLSIGNKSSSPWCDFANYVGCPDGAPLPVKIGREKGKTPEGVYDLAGNADEWCRDWYGPYSPNAQNDPKGPVSGDRRVVRGTYDPPPRGSSRERERPESGAGDTGFRVVFSSGHR